MEESLASRREMGDKRGTAESLQTLRGIALLAGQADEIERLARKVIAIHKETGDRTGLAYGINGLPVVLFSVVRYGLADSFGFADKLLKRSVRLAAGATISWELLPNVAKDNVDDLILCHCDCCSTNAVLSCRGS